MEQQGKPWHNSVLCSAPAQQSPAQVPDIFIPPSLPLVPIISLCPQFPLPLQN